jgi:cold shock CspA family protein
MGRSQETSNKKEVRTKKEKKRKAKAQKREKKKSDPKKSNFEDMIAYVDEFGRISSTPLDPDKKIEVDVEDIEYASTRNKPRPPEDLLHSGIVTFFNDSKGYGFIRDLESNKSIFVHINNIEDTIVENNKVVFEIGKGPKGPLALKVKLKRD